MLVSKLLVASFGLLATLVVAAPVSERSCDDADILLDAREPMPHKPNPIVQAVRVAKAIKKDLHPPANGAVFWSGHRPGKKGPVSVYQAAQSYAKKNGKQTLEQGLRKSGITIPKTNPHAAKLWDVASRTWAQRAKGDVHAILGSSIRPASVWNRVEKGALAKNHEVTRITAHNQDSKTSTIIKGKK